MTEQKIISRIIEGNGEDAVIIPENGGSILCRARFYRKSGEGQSDSIGSPGSSKSAERIRFIGQLESRADLLPTGRTRVIDSSGVSYWMIAAKTESRGGVPLFVSGVLQRIEED